MTSRSKTRIHALACVAAAGFATAALAAGTTGAASIFTGAGSVQNQPALTASATEVVAAWHQVEPGGPSIVLGWLDPATGAVDRQVHVQADGGWSMNPAAAALENVWAVAWQERMENGFQVQAAGVTSSGSVAWGPLTVSRGSGPAFDPAVASVSGKLAIAWFDLRSGAPGVYFTVLSGDGAQVAAERLLSKPGQAAHYPAVAAVGGGFVVAWHELDAGQPRIFVQRFSDQGLSLGPAVRVEGSAPSGWYPALAAADDGFAVAFHAPGAEGWEIRLQRFGAGGAPRGAAQVLSAAGAQAMNPSLAWDGQRFVAAWMERGGDAPQARFVTVGAAPDSAPVTVAQESAAFPVVAAHGGVFWSLSAGQDASGEQLHTGRDGRSAIPGEVTP